VRRSRLSVRHGDRRKLGGEECRAEQEGVDHFASRLSVTLAQ
jgi:hypothetical protein